MISYLIKKLKKIKIDDDIDNQLNVIFINNEMKNF